MTPSQRHVIWNKEDDLNWDIIEISKVNNKMIKRLIENLKKDISERFFISFESLIKISRIKNIKKLLENSFRVMDDNDWHRDLLKFILKYIKNKELKHPLAYQLYHPDFIKRVRAILQAEHDNSVEYKRIILPLLDDPDDSVRWAALNYFINLGQVDEREIQNKLKLRQEREINKTILQKITQNLKKIQAR